MGKVLDLVDALQAVLRDAAEHLARPSGFLRRTSKMTAPCFVQTMVFGSLSHPELHLRDLAQTAALSGVSITPQGLDQRFGEASACLMRGVLDAVVSTAVNTCLDGVAAPQTDQEAVPTLLERFTEVELIDSTVIALPRELAGDWPGCNSTQGSTAAMKLDVVFDMRHGTLRGPELRPGRAHDSTAALAGQVPAAGALCLQDRGYFSQKRFTEIAEAEAYWLSLYKRGTTLYDEQQQPITLLKYLRGSDTVDCVVYVGAQKLPARLLARRVPTREAQARRRRLRHTQCKHGRTPSKEALALCGWTVMLTNVPAEMLSLPEAEALLGVRWQIELLFKLWKSDLQIDSCTSRKPWHVLTEIYAKLIAMTLEHWILQAGVWQIPDRSLRKAAHAVRACALMLLRALPRRRALQQELQTLLRCMRVACRLERRRRHPNVYQTLTAGTDPAYA